LLCRSIRHIHHSRCERGETNAHAGVDGGNIGATTIGGAICYHTAPEERSESNHLRRVAYEEAYPNIPLSPRSRSWYARLKGTAPECVHLETSTDWMATLLPDVVYLNGRTERRRAELRPEVSVCRECLLDTATPEMTAFDGRVVAFEPSRVFTQYFFVEQREFDPAGMTPEVAAAIGKRLEWKAETCADCSRQAKWLWISRAEVPSLDEPERIADAKGQLLCAVHGAGKLRQAFEKIDEANLMYVNLPYGEAGAYVWI
jgi:hypothetical protein